MKISIISSSIREGRKSHHVALFIEKWLKEYTEAEINMIDLLERDFPLFNERLNYQIEKNPKAQQFSDEIKSSDAVIMVCPEYNGSFPASIKNVIDVLYDEWQKKPIMLAMVSSGDFAGTQAAMHLEFVMYKIGAHVAKNRLHVGNVEDNFNQDGENIANQERFNKSMQNCVAELKELM